MPETLTIFGGKALDAEPELPRVIRIETDTSVGANLPGVASETAPPVDRLRQFARQNFYVHRAAGSESNPEFTRSKGYRDKTDNLAAFSGALRDISKMQTQTQAVVADMARQIAQLQSQISELVDPQDWPHVAAPALAAPEDASAEDLGDWLSYAADVGMTGDNVTKVALAQLSSEDAYVRAAACRALSVAAPELVSLIQEAFASETNETARRIIGAALKALEA